MADTKISAMTAATAATASTVPVVQGGVNKKLSMPGAGAAMIEAADAAAQQVLLGITGGGAIALGGFTFTIPASGTAALLGVANVFTGANTFASGTIVTNQPAINVTQTWNNAAVGFKAMFFNITTTAADYGNTALMEFQRNSSTIFKMDHGGSMSWPGVGMFWDTNNLKAQLPASGFFSINDDVRVTRDAAGVMGIRNGTNVQALRLYDTFTDASNYARLSFITTAGSYSIKPEAAGTGTLRDLHISGLPTSNPGPGILWNNAGTPAIGT